MAIYSPKANLSHLEDRKPAGDLFPEILSRSPQIVAYVLREIARDAQRGVGGEIRKCGPIPSDRTRNSRSPLALTARRPAPFLLSNCSTGRKCRRYSRPIVRQLHVSYRDRTEAEWNAVNSFNR